MTDLRNLLLSSLAIGLSSACTYRFYPAECEKAVVVRYSYLNDPGSIYCGGRARYYPLHLARQVEGICFDEAGDLYLSSVRSL